MPTIFSVSFSEAAGFTEGLAAFGRHVLVFVVHGSDAQVVGFDTFRVAADLVGDLTGYERPSQLVLEDQAVNSVEGPVDTYFGLAGFVDQKDVPCFSAPVGVSWNGECTLYNTLKDIGRYHVCSSQTGSGRTLEWWQPSWAYLCAYFTYVNDNSV